MHRFLETIIHQILNNTFPMIKTTTWSFYRGDGKILKIEKKDGKYVPKLIDRLTVNVDGDYVSIKDDKEDVTYIFDEYGILTSN